MTARTAITTPRTAATGRTAATRAAATGRTAAGYLMEDEFTTARGAGSVNGTACEPSPGTRTVTDSNSRISIAGGVLVCAGGAAALAWGDPRVTFGSYVWAGGRMVIAKFVPTSGNWAIGFGNGSGATPTGVFFKIAGTSLQVLANAAVNGTAVTVGTVTMGQTYYIAIDERTAGAFWFIKGGTEYAAWTEIWSSIVYSTTPSYPGFWNYDGVFTLDDIQIHSRIWNPQPRVSDSMAGANGTALSAHPSDGLGHAEANGGGGLTWLHDAGCWAIQGNAAVGTPTAGGELVTGWTNGTAAPYETFASSGVNITSAINTSGEGCGDTNGLAVTAGIWYQALINPTINSGGGVGGVFSELRTAVDIGGTFRQTLFASPLASGAQRTVLRSAQTETQYWSAYMSAGAVNWSATGVSFKPLTLSSLIAVTNVGSADVLAEAKLTRVAGTQVGLATCINNQATPTAGIFTYLDGAGNIKVAKFTAANTWTNLATTAVTYVASAVLRVITYSSGGNLYARIFYNNAAVGSELTIADAGIISNTWHGIMSTYSGNTADDYVAWDRNTRYAFLDQL